MIKAVIDTSSLVSLVRYYLPFDKHNKLSDLIKEKFKSNELVIIDEVLQECKFTSKCIVVNNLSYLTDKDFQKTYKLPTNTKDLLPPSPAKFYNQVDNQFINRSIRNKFSDVEYESLKASFLNSADARMIIYCLNELKKNTLGEIVLVTEESEESNDHKAFKKIPAICKQLDIKVISLPQLIELYSEIDLAIS